MEPPTRIELATFPLPWECSTTELGRLKIDAVMNVSCNEQIHFLRRRKRRLGTALGRLIGTPS